jgi:hypothetical protein
LSARDDVCVFPTCNQPGYRCEPDHTIPHAAGGRTRRDNLALTCRRHNQAKAGTGWTYRHNAAGTFTWTTASGHQYTGPPNGSRRSTPPADTTPHGEEEDPPPF